MNRDLYKRTFRLSPLISSDLAADAFELAWDIRVMDMRAAPYELTGLGLDPIRIETAEGRRTYTELQRQFAERGAPLRAHLIAECDRLLGLLDREADTVRAVGQAPRPSGSRHSRSNGSRQA